MLETHSWTSWDFSFLGVVLVRHYLGVRNFQGNRLNEKAIRNEVVRHMQANCFVILHLYTLSRGWFIVDCLCPTRI